MYVSCMSINKNIKKTIYLNKIQCKRLDIIVNLGYYATESELIRMALNIGLDSIEKKVLDKEK
jgi:Arc/MetJ-type ribon-helix-helix transcriptional regulator